MIFERSIEQLLELDYDSLKSYLLMISEDECKRILSNDEIKYKLINSPTRHKFIWLAQERNDYIIPTLLEGKGIELFGRTIELSDKINGIITSGNSYLKELFKNIDFVKLVFKHFKDLGHLFTSIESEVALILVKNLKSLNLSNEELVNVVLSLNEKAQALIVDNMELPNEMFWSLVINMRPKASEALLHKNSIGKHLDDLTVTSLKKLFENAAFLPLNIVEDLDFINILTSMLDAKVYRMLMLDLELSNDIDAIEKKRESFYDEKMKDYNSKYGMLNCFYELYKKFGILLEFFKDDNLSIKYVEDLITNKFDLNYFHDMYFDVSKIKTPEALLNYFQAQSNFEITNMIIDYHFKDVYFNVLKDIEILCNFNETGGKSLSDEDLELYKSILHLDELSYEDKIKLHEKMKSYNFIEKFYDDIRNAKNLSYQMINESILNKERLKKYRNEELSAKVGVDIYLLDGDPFKVLVKSFGNKYTSLERNSFKSYSHISSFSLDGSDKLETFYDPKTSYNVVYDSLKEEQVIHTFPVDSFTSRPSANYTKATQRLNQILTPDELVIKSLNYNEVLIRQAVPNSPTEYDEKITPPEMIALYCYDEITDLDIESAKNLEIGIVLVITRNYEKKVNNNQIGMLDTMSLGGEELLDYNYLTQMNQNAGHGRR